MGPKRDLYAQIGISEYWRFDPTGGTYYNQPLTGEQLINGTYQPFELTTEPDGILKGYSPALKRYLCWHDGMTELYDPRNQHVPPQPWSKRWTKSAQNDLLGKKPRKH